MNYEEILNKLSKSEFRNSFHLNKKMKEYVLTKGLDTIKEHAYDFINDRLKPKYIKNDGKQTPMRQACCCRGCLYKWHHIEKNKELTSTEVDYIANLLMEWIKKEINLK